MAERVHVLLVEDSADDAVLVRRALEKGGLSVSVERVETREELARALEGPVQVVLADYNLPRFDVLEALAMVQAHRRDIPFIVVTGTIGEERAADLLRRGAHDFVLKRSPERLAPAVERELREVRIRRERAAVRRELDRARARYEALVENSSDVTYVVNRDGRVLFASPSAEGLVGVPRGELIGRNAFRFVHPRDRRRVYRALAAVVAGARRREEYRLVRADGEVRHVESVATNLLAENAVGGIVVNTRDVTQRKLLEGQLLQARKMEAVGRLAGGVAHDFNNLLTVIRGNARILLDSLAEGSEGRGDLQEVVDAADRATALTRQLLAFSKKQVLDPRVVDVTRVIDDLVGTLRSLVGPTVELRVRRPAEILSVRVDPVQLEQVLMNLVVNARDAMGDGGTVEVSVDGRPAADLLPELDAPTAEQYVRITVRDTGPGIPPEIRERIFEPFFSTKETGTGLGLSTVYGIVAQSGGHVWVECPTARGTRFVVALPRVETSPTTPVDAGSSEAPVASAHGHVLVVEDSPDVRRVTRRILSRDGFEVVEADSGPAALELVRASGRLDLLVTDMVMPGMQGPQLARAIRALHPDLPVLFMSGYREDEQVEAGELEGARAFLAKPFTPQELSQAVRRLLDPDEG